MLWQSVVMRIFRQKYQQGIFLEIGKKGTYPMNKKTANKKIIVVP
jgi:hypothetical protein